MGHFWIAPFFLENTDDTDKRLVQTFHIYGFNPKIMLFNNVLGQSQAKHILSQALSQSRLSHAYLFYGPESIGKSYWQRNLQKL